MNKFLKILKQHQILAISSLWVLTLCTIGLDCFCSYFTFYLCMNLNHGIFFPVFEFENAPKQTELTTYVTSEMILLYFVSSLKICMSIENQEGYKGILIFYSKKQQHNHFCDAGNSNMYTKVIHSKQQKDLKKSAQHSHLGR